MDSVCCSLKHWLKTLLLLSTPMWLRPCHGSVRRFNRLKSSTAAEAIQTRKLRLSFEKRKYQQFRLKEIQETRLQLDFVNFPDLSYQCKRPLDSCPGASVTFGINLFVEEVLPEHVKLSVLFSDGVGAHELKLFLGKLVELVLHFPDVGLLQLGCGLFGGGLFFSGLSQVRLLPLSKTKKKKTADA